MHCFGKRNENTEYYNKWSLMEVFVIKGHTVNMYTDYFEIEEVYFTLVP